MAIIQKIHINPANNMLIFQHSPCFESVFYDLCKSNGQIVEYGYLNQVGRTAIDIGKLKPGQYYIQIVHEGEIFREKVILKPKESEQIPSKS